MIIKIFTGFPKEFKLYRVESEAITTNFIRSILSFVCVALLR